MTIGDRVYAAYFNALGEVEVQENRIRSMGRRVRLVERLEAWRGHIDVDFADVHETPEIAVLALQARVELEVDVARSTLLSFESKLKRVRDARDITLGYLRAQVLGRGDP
jgi:hypothetical protein